MNEIEETPALKDAELATDVSAAVRAALQEAVRRAGSQQKLVELIGGDVERGHLSYWLRKGTVPEKHCAVIELSTGVSRRALCPAWRRVWPELAQRPDAPAEHRQEAA